MKNRIELILLSLLLSIHVFAQQEKLTVRGMVIGDDNLPAIGANVYVKDRPYIGTVTDIDGNFSLNIERGDKLAITYMGCEPFEKLMLESDNNIRVVLKASAAELEQVVVTGMGGTQRRVSIAGAITTVDVSQIQTPSTSVTNMLGGVVPGIITLQTSGEPGENLSEFWIRGIGTFGAGDAALVLIDGIEGNLNSIDPADIEDFHVLKDASATAMYGVRGANGVVLVTTKRGVAGKLKIDVRVNTKLSQLTRLPEYLGAYDYANLYNEARVVRGREPRYSDIEMQIIQKGLDPDMYPDVNWQDELIKKFAWTESAYISGRGGSDVAQYFLSVGMRNESSSYKKAPDSKYASSVGYNLFNFRANITMNLTSTTKLYFGSEGEINRKTLPGSSNMDDLWEAQAIVTPLAFPVMYSTGQTPASDDNLLMSPYARLNYTGKTMLENSIAKFHLELKQDLKFLLDGLSFRALGSYQHRGYFEETRLLWPAMHFASRRDADGTLVMVEKVKEQTVIYSRKEDQYRKYHFNANFNYEGLFNQEHRVGALLYYEMEDDKKSTFAEQGSNGVFAIPKRYQTLSGRLTYGFRDTYFLDMNFGYGGSESFAPGHQWGFFPSIAGAWVPTGYDVVNEKLPWLDFMKLRASFGIAGNDKIKGDERFLYQTIVKSTGTGWGFNGNGLIEDVIGADNLRWEKSKKMDIGLEGTLFHNRISFVVDYFYDKRDGIFQERQKIPGYVGLITMPWGNVGETTSYGSDGNVSFTHQINNDMSFVIRGNYTVTRNKIHNWEEIDPAYPYQTNAGKPIGYQSGLIALGLFKDEDDIKHSPKQDFGAYMPGDIKYKDVNGDGVVNNDDKVALDYSYKPRIMYGFGGEFRYKRLTVSALFRGTGNSYFYHTGSYPDKHGNWKTWRGGYIPFFNGTWGNVLNMVADQSNRWTPASYSGDPATENPNARFPRLSYQSNSNNDIMSTFWKDNQRYLRFQELNISYNLPAGAFLRNLGVSSIDLQFVGNNLAVWDQIKIFDPEQAFRNGRGYPIPRTYTFQAYIHF